MKYWEIIADRLSAAGFTWGCVATINSKGEQFLLRMRTAMTRGALLYTPMIKLTAFVELDRQALTLAFYLESIHGDSYR